MSNDTFIGLPMDIEDVTEPKAGPEGDYNLIVTNVKIKPADEGEMIDLEVWNQQPCPVKNILAICEITGGPVGVNIEEVANVLHNISIPQASDDSEKIKNKLLFAKRFMALFQVPMAGNQINPNLFLGKTAKAHLVQDDYNGTISNKIKLPNLR